MSPLKRTTKVLEEQNTSSATFRPRRWAILAILSFIIILSFLTTLSLHSAVKNSSQLSTRRRRPPGLVFFQTYSLPEDSDPAPRSKTPIYKWILNFTVPYFAAADAFDFFWSRFNTTSALSTLDKRREEEITNTRLVHSADSRTAWYRHVLWDQMKIRRVPEHNRKEAEFVLIFRVVQNLIDLKKPGVAGFGLGVGREPLPSAFVLHGVTDLIVSDMPSANFKSNMSRDMWRNSNQYAASLESTWMEQIVDRESYFKAASYRAVDMSKIPADLLQPRFDFVWSCSSLEHQGTLQLVEEFILNTALMLKPGGVSVHTSELIVSSLDLLIEREGNFMMLRAKDVERIASRLESAPYSARMTARDWDAGVRDVEDLRCDVAPFHGQDHLKLFRQDTIKVWGNSSSGGDSESVEETRQSCHTSILIVIIKNM